MGGRALLGKGIETRRYEDAEYQLICKDVLGKLNMLFPNNKFYIIQAYHTKQSHGDMDVIMRCGMNDHFDKITDEVNELFKPRATHKNDGVFSFDYMDFQIDLIHSHEDFFEYQCEGMDYDPTLNLMGKIFHKFGLSYKHKGLYYVIRNFSGRVAKDILLTRNMRETFEFGGFDYDRYSKGFDTLVEIFDFILESKYFNFEFFKLENLTQKDRKRNRKRSTYNAFVTYCNEKLELGYDLKRDRTELYQGKNTAAGFKFSKDKEVYLEKINNAFPHAKIFEKIEKFRINDKIIEECAQKFNGKIIMGLYPDLLGKELGDFMVKFKEFMDIAHDSKALREVIHPLAPEAIIEKIHEFYQIYKK